MRVATVITAIAFIAALSSPASEAKQLKTPARIANQIVQTWACQAKLGVPRSHARSPWKLGQHSEGFKVALLQKWIARRKACVAALAEVRRQQNWQAWLPDKWRRIGVCETQLNWRHSNSSYQGAFGFAVSSWDAFKLPGYPAEAWQATPWQQYQVALAIHARYGLSGWGCRNA